jgi:hypothetical protein
LDASPQRIFDQLAGVILRQIATRIAEELQRLRWLTVTGACGQDRALDYLRYRVLARPVCQIVG